ncbi:MAG: GNAT family N-acetyltransferase [Pseudomonadota bacterium]
MTFERQPTLPGALIRLRPLRPEDEEALYAVASDPLIWQQHPASTRYLKHEFGRYFAEAIESQGALLVLETGSAEPVGTSRYGRYCEGEKEIEIGWTFLARRCWGGSYNGELKRLMLNHAFGVVWATIPGAMNVMVALIIRRRF